MEKIFIIAISMQVLLTFIIYWILVKKRRAAAIKGEVDIAFYRTGMGTEAESVSPVLKSLTSQFELPILFYVVCGLVLMTKSLDWPMVGLAWIFVLSRFFHFYAHCVLVKLKLRFRSFLVGFITCGLMWGVFLVKQLVMF